MRTLYLLRHGKSSWNDDSLRDFDRPLKGRGRKGAELVGQRLATEKLRKPLVICSPALRTRETLDIVRSCCGLTAEERFDDRIYEASLRDLLLVVSEIPDQKRVVILIGHNPGFEELLGFLTREQRRMPTCALAKIKLDIESWKDVISREGKLEWFTTPKELEDSAQKST